MQFRYVLAISSFAIAVPSASLHAQDTAPAPGKWSLSVGVDPSNLDLHTPEPGVQASMVANLTRNWQSANSKFGRHISLMVGLDAPHEMQPLLFTPSGPQQCDCAMHLSRKYAGLTAGASYDLVRVSRFTPYVTGGAGVYYDGYQSAPTRGFSTAAELQLYQNGAFSDHTFSLGANAGLGLRVRLGSHELFVEQAIHQFDLTRRGVGVAPLSIGFRF
jgi:hypothetical protein